MDYNSGMGGVNLRHAYWTKYHSTRKRPTPPKRKTIKSTFVIWLISVVWIHIYFIKKGGNTSRMELQVKLIQNLISKYHIIQERPPGRPAKSVLLTRMNAHHYAPYIAARMSEQNLCQCCVMCYKEGQHYETRYNCENCRMALYAAPFPTLPFGNQLLEVWKGIGVQQVAKKCLKVRFQWLESALCAGIENYTITIKNFTVCATGVATMFPVV
jgi:hypothetical protein